MSLSSKIAEVTAALKWPLSQVRSSGGSLEITSDPWARTHTVSVPPGEIRAIEYLHELAHAVLAERHNLLSTAHFSTIAPGAKWQNLINPIRIASDWFSDDLLRTWAQPEADATVIEHMLYVDKIINPDEEISYAGGLFHAQSVLYCGHKTYNIPRRYRAVALILLDTPPANPTPQKKQKIVNRLAALYYREQITLRPMPDKIDLWQVTLAKGAKK